jgi:hypothetical protein
MMIKSRGAVGLCLAASFLVVVWVPGISHVIADEPPIADESGELRDTILALDDQFWEAASRHDVETLGRLFADDYHGIGNDGTRWTKKMILEQHRTTRLSDLKRTSDRQVIRVGNDTALLTYDARFKVLAKDRVPRDTTHQRLLSCWVQRDGGWFVRFSQATDLVVPATQFQPSDPLADRRSRSPEGPKERNEDRKPGMSKTTIINLRDVIVDEVDAVQNTITVTIGRNDTPGGKVEGINDQGGKNATGERKVSMRLVNLPVTKDGHIRISSRRFPSVANNVQRDLSELTSGMPASLELTVGEGDLICPITVSKIVGWREP